MCEWGGCGAIRYQLLAVQAQLLVIRAMGMLSQKIEKLDALGFLLRLCSIEIDLHAEIADHMR